MGDFKQWNPSKANQQLDAAYLTESLRVNGARDGDICYAAMDNKFRYQVTTFITALANALVGKGYTIQDDSLSTLQAQLANIFTVADYIQPDWNLTSGLGSILNKPTIIEPVNADWNETDTEDLAYIKNKPYVMTPLADFVASLTENGYQRLPSGLLLQWGKYDNRISGETTISVTFPIAFSTNCLNVTGNGMNIAGSLQANTHFQIRSITKTNFSCFTQGSSSADFIDGVYWFAVGY